MKRKNKKSARKKQLSLQCQKESKYALPNLKEIIENTLRNDSEFSDVIKSSLKLYYPNDWQRVLKECGIGVLSGACLVLKTVVIRGLLDKLYAPSIRDEINLTALYGCIFIPVFEEFMYRGLLTMLAEFQCESYMKPAFAQNAAIVGVNTLFALSHPSNKVSSFISGFFYQKLQINNKGSLWSGTAAHITHNSLVHTFLPY